MSTGIIFEISNNFSEQSARINLIHQWIRALPTTHMFNQLSWCYEKSICVCVCVWNEIVPSDHVVPVLKNWYVSISEQPCGWCPPETSTNVTKRDFKRWENKNADACKKFKLSCFMGYENRKSNVSKLICYSEQCIILNVHICVTKFTWIWHIKHALGGQSA